MRCEVPVPKINARAADKGDSRAVSPAFSAWSVIARMLMARHIIITIIMIDTAITLLSLRSLRSIPATPWFDETFPTNLIPGTDAERSTETGTGSLSLKVVAPTISFPVLGDSSSVAGEPGAGGCRVGFGIVINSDM